MIDTLAEAHGISKRQVENEYYKYDYYVHLARKNMEGKRMEKRMEKEK